MPFSSILELHLELLESGVLLNWTQVPLTFENVNLQKVFPSDY